MQYIQMCVLCYYRGMERGAAFWTQEKTNCDIVGSFQKNSDTVAQAGSIFEREYNIENHIVVSDKHL